jgi:glycosyltransferase involved in cell wall biosynthesis
VVPVGVNPDRLLGYDVDARFARRLHREAGPAYVLCVSQLFPHKRHELAIEAVHLLQDVHGLDVGLVIVGATRSPNYRTALHALVDELGVRRVIMTWAISDRQLATAYSGAAVYVTASEHEGLALPPLEAMAFGVPVVARNYGALGDTVGSAGVLLGPEDGPRHIAEAIAEVLASEPLRKALRVRGVRRIRDWQPDHTMARFLDLVAGAL